jgi:hypothetical protein
LKSRILPRRIFLAAVLLSSLFATGCIKEVAKTLGEIQTVHAELTKKFGDDVYVNVNENGKSMIVTVSFINSALNEKPQEERFKRAAEAATVVKTHYKRIDKVNAIWVGFVRRKTRMLVFHHTEGLNFYPFDKEAKWIQPPPSETTNPGVVLGTTANYSANDNYSSVFANGIQLEGVPGKDGVTLLPNFKTTGDVNVKKGKPPKSVQFDFASYASTPRFEQTEPIVFIADGKSVLQTKGTFHGNDAQFCYLPVPYSAFRKMIAAKAVIIKVGAKVYALTPRQMGALQQMGDYVTE